MIDQRPAVRLEHVDEVADQMLALARRLAVADDRRAEAREDEGSNEPLHDLDVAGNKCRRIVEQWRLVILE